MSSAAAAAPGRLRGLRAAAAVALASPIGAAGAAILLLFALMAIFASALVPYDPLQVQYLPGHRVAQLLPPSHRFLFGTTYYGRDVLSQLIVGTRVAMIVGLTSAFFITVIGTNVGLISGYYGGWVDTILMRITDVVFGIPFLPFAVVLVALLNPSLFNIVLTISCLLWRTTARVIRSQVLSLRERPFVKAAKVTGAGDLRVMYVHILPNVLPMSLLYVALGIGWAVLAEASLSFLGFGDPQMLSWGEMLYSAYLTGSFRSSWWVVVPPGVCITLFVASAFMIGREFEILVNPRLRQP
ncbi:MAG TPA: ABC transporter permease [Alphaproteobacteria bacterium]|nr:ABC transporter permease [Alphaproteobacteria bacterium]